jgi:hypothetical protein
VWGRTSSHLSVCGVSRSSYAGRLVCTGCPSLNLSRPPDMPRVKTAGASCGCIEVLGRRARSAAARRSAISVVCGATTGAS